MSFDEKAWAKLSDTEKLAMVNKFAAAAEAKNASAFRISDNGCGWVTVQTGIGAGGQVGCTVVALQALFAQQKAIGEYLHANETRMLAEHKEYQALGDDAKAAMKARKADERKAAKAAK